MTDIFQVDRLETISFLFSRPDMTSVVDWALRNNDLFSLCLSHITDIFQVDRLETISFLFSHPDMTFMVDWVSWSLIKT